MCVSSSIDLTAATRRSISRRISALDMTPVADGFGLVGAPPSRSSSSSAARSMPFFVSATLASLSSENRRRASVSASFAFVLARSSSSLVRSSSRFSRDISLDMPSCPRDVSSSTRSRSRSLSSLISSSWRWLMSDRCSSCCSRSSSCSSLFAFMSFSTSSADAPDSMRFFISSSCRASMAAHSFCSVPSASSRSKARFCASSSSVEILFSAAMSSSLSFSESFL
mmetsp:Transcript_13533/g.42119  ORF Transcript_13533/g.42119 Transcript_13533/m.42119 type:complete len:225 (-) Transcript_13533:102-776(-)